jgi:hypothetical protein
MTVIFDWLLDLGKKFSDLLAMFNIEVYGYTFNILAFFVALTVVTMFASVVLKR